MTAVDEALAAPARSFLRAAWPVLERQRVVPPPRCHPYIKVGRDYFGPDLFDLPEFKALEQAIEGTNSRFRDSMPLGARDFAGGYIFSFLETVVAQLSLADAVFSPANRVVTEAIHDLATAVGADEWEVACCRVATHLTTDDGEALEIAGVSVVPVGGPGGVGARNAHGVIHSVIAGAATAYDRVPPVVHAPPESVVIARATQSDPFGMVNVLSGRIERFLLLVRLLHAGTSESAYEVQGETSPVRRFTPTLVRFRGTGGSFLGSPHKLRRSVGLSRDDGPAIDGLWELMASAERERPGMIVTSFAMAVQKFQLSYHAHTWYEQLVDLATALEAALAGKHRSEVVLRLRSRAAALLWTDRDPAAVIFNDVGRLYDLRSSFVHGGELKEKQLLKSVQAISTVPGDLPIGIALGHVVDRLRDLVRRSLLVRICLAGGDKPLWPLGADEGVDAGLSDDATRAEWRLAARTTLEALGAASALDRPRQGVDFLSSDAG